MLPPVLSLQLREEKSEIWDEAGSLPQPGLRRDLEESLLEEEERQEVKQMKTT